MKKITMNNVKEAMNSIGFAADKVHFNADTSVTTMTFVSYLDDLAAEIKYGSFKAITGKPKQTEEEKYAQ